jgi:hypothetical protein
MGGDQRRAAARQMARTTSPNSATEACIQRDGGFVQHPDRAARHHQPRQPQPPLLPGRQVLRRRSAMRQVHPASAAAIPRVP